MKISSAPTLDRADQSLQSSVGASWLHDNNGLSAHLKAFVVGVALSAAAAAISLMISGLPH
jgi:hypothetical protein